MANLLTNIAQTCADLTNIKNAIQDKGVDIASGTPSSEYSSKIDEVYEAGKQELLDLHPEVTVSGNYISVDDVSELPHEVKCKVSGVADPTSVTVTKCGRNLLNPNTLGSGELVEYNGVPCYKYKDQNASTGGWKIEGCFKENTPYTISLKCYRHASASIKDHVFFIEYNDGTSFELRINSNELEMYTSDAKKTISRIYIASYAWMNAYLDLSVSCLYEGTTALPYEPYNGQTLTPKADGTVEGMTSVSPYMNIFTDNVEATLEATYRKSAGFDVGKQAEYDRFWDEFQQNGERKGFRGLFAGAGWNVDTFNPKYKTSPTGTNAVYMFMFCNYGGENLDFRNYKHLFDFSGITSALSMFQDAWIDYIEVDFSNATTIGSAFSESYSAGHKTHITLKVSEKCTTLSGFGSCAALTHLFFADGSVIAGAIDLRSCPLTKDSFISVINALSPTITGKTVTFKKTAKEAVFTQEEWEVLIATKSNWTFSLV